MKRLNDLARPASHQAPFPSAQAPQAIRQRIEALEMVLERSFTLPGTKFAIGLDAVIGLVPVLGDVLAALLGSYLLWEARNLGLPRWKMWQMGANLAFDTALGAIPLIGDAADVLFRSNTRNLRIIKRHLDKHHPQTRIIEG